MSNTIERREDGTPMCQCEVYQHCFICDPDGYRHNLMRRTDSKGVKEQKEAAILNSVLAAVTEQHRGTDFNDAHSIDDETGELVISIRRVGVKDPCRIRILLEV